MFTTVSGHSPTQTSIKLELKCLEDDYQIVSGPIINSYIQSIDGPPRARRIYRDRECEIGEQRLMENYFVSNPTYDAAIFRRRFRMQRPLFRHIVDAVTANDVYFQQRRDATGWHGLSPLQKCTGAMRVLAYRASVDALDEYLRMSETGTRDALIKFVEGVISCFGDECLKKPNRQDLTILLYAGEQRGFPGSLNDINVLHRSPVFNDILTGKAPKVSYFVNGHEYDRGYYLTNGIYPSWAAFVKPIRSPLLLKHKLFAKHQQSVRKDVKRAFGFLQARFAFIRRPCLVWDKDIMRRIMIACIIMHNMIVEDERDTFRTYYDTTEFLNDMPPNRQQPSMEDNNQPTEYSTERIANLSRYMINRGQLRNAEAHCALRNDLVEHIWQKFNR